MANLEKQDHALPEGVGEENAEKRAPAKFSSYFKFCFF